MLSDRESLASSVASIKRRISTVMSAVNQVNKNEKKSLTGWQGVVQKSLESEKTAREHLTSDLHIIQQNQVIFRLLCNIMLLSLLFSFL